MLNSLRSQLERPAHVVGLGITLLPGAEVEIAVCVLQRRGATVTIAQQQTGLPSLASLANLSLPAGAALALVIAGRGILYKALPAADALTDHNDQLAFLLPGADANDFYLQVIDGPTYRHLTVIRRQVLDELLTGLAALGFYTVDASLGPFRFLELLGYLDPQVADSSPTVGNYNLVLQAGEIISLLPLAPAAVMAGDDLEIGEDKLSPQLVLPYAAALAVLVESSRQVLNTGAVAVSRREWQQRQLFRLAGRSVLAVFFGALLVNFIVFSSLSEKSQGLMKEAMANRKSLAVLTDMRRSLQEKKAFLTQAGWLQPTTHSLWADELAASVPPGLHLTTVDLTPYDKQRSIQGQRPIFQNGLVLVQGQCRDAQTLNLWLQQINQFAWVKAIRGQDFTYDYTSDMGTFTFMLYTQPLPRQAQ